MFGILTETPGSTSTTTVLFLNVANGNRTGPGRLWVDLARRWAGAGLRCFRMDLSGLGDSPVRHDRQQRLVLRAPEHFDDVAEACSQLCPEDPSNVVLVGHCTSGYQALESALAIKPRAVVALNPVTTFRLPERGAGLRTDPRRRIALPRNTMTYDDRVRAYYRARDYPGPSPPARCPATQAWAGGSTRLRHPVFAQPDGCASSSESLATTSPGVSR